MIKFVYTIFKNATDVKYVVVVVHIEAHVIFKKKKMEIKD